MQGGIRHQEEARGEPGAVTPSNPVIWERKKSLQGWGWERRQVVLSSRRGDPPSCLLLGSWWEELTATAVTTELYRGRETSAQGSLYLPKRREKQASDGAPRDWAAPSSSHRAHQHGCSATASYRGSHWKAAKKQRQWQIKNWQGFWNDLIPQRSI